MSKLIHDGNNPSHDGKGLRMKKRTNSGICLLLLGTVALAQEIPAASSNPNPRQTDEEILQQSVWRMFFGDHFDLVIGEPTPRPQPYLSGPGPQPKPGYPSSPYTGIARELEFIEHLWSENDMVDEYKALAKRPYLSEMDQILFVNSAYSNLDFDRNIAEVLIALIGNPCFTEGARDAILDGLNAGKIWDSSRRKKIFDALQNRGELIPSPRDPQRWIGFHFSGFQRSIRELQEKSIELERRLLEVEKKTHQLAEFDRRVLALEKRPLPSVPAGSADFEKRLTALEKRNLQPEEFHKRISVLESRIPSSIELEKRISALEKTVQQRGPAPAPAQPVPIADLQKQLAVLEAKVKQLEAEVKKQEPKPRVPEKASAPERTPGRGPE